MSIKFEDFLVKFNNLIDDNLTGTTDAAGNAGGTTLIDSALKKYDDGYFGDPGRDTVWWVYVESQLRSIKKFISATGTINVHKAFTAQIASSKAYALHRFNRDKKKVAINQALNQAYPSFYARVEDATTLDGTGASVNKYTVPVTFTEFPTEIWKIHIADTKYTRTQITDYETEEIGGTRYFYANITEGDDILLIGKTYLSQFTTDTSTTELSDSQADVVVLLAASILYRNLSGFVNAADSGRFDSLANRYEAMYEARKIGAMPILTSGKLDWNWLNK